ncbi:MAG: hypothetical protein ACYC3L_14315, partial [Gemmatimonadaceae bacterium]
MRSPIIRRLARAANVTGRFRGTGRVLGAALLALTLQAPAPVGAQRADLQKVIRRQVLANGLEVVVAENHGVPLATVEVVV